MTTPLVVTDALSHLPAEVRDHVTVERATPFSVTLSMTLEALEAWSKSHHAEVERLRDLADDAIHQKIHAEDELDEAQSALLDLAEAVYKASESSFKDLERNKTMMALADAAS